MSDTSSTLSDDTMTTTRGLAAVFGTNNEDVEPRARSTSPNDRTRALPEIPQELMQSFMRQIREYLYNQDNETRVVPIEADPQHVPRACYNRYRSDFDKAIIPFTGSSSKEDPFKWLFEYFQAAIRRNGWTQEQCLDNIDSYLTDAALAWWDYIRPTITRWTGGNRQNGFAPGTFTHAFVKRFITPEMKAHWNAELQVCKQRPGEDVAGFASRLRGLKKRVELSRQVTDNELSNLLQQGLPLQIRNALSAMEIQQRTWHPETYLRFELRVELAQNFEFQLRANGDVDAVKIPGEVVTTETGDEVKVVASQFMPSLTSEVPEDKQAHKVITEKKTSSSKKPESDKSIDELTKQMSQLRILLAKQQRLAEVKKPRSCPHCDSTDRNHRWNTCERRQVQEGYFGNTVRERIVHVFQFFLLFQSLHN
ncbi:hypothetical protein BDF22DRAFT_221638 [Syncephalis plumigaleata]|nr:hypothetical protein BDF22DRAFT_221638 [Syncephalis plumigaleata]